MKTNIDSAGCTRVLLAAVITASLCHGAQGAQYQWDFGGNLNTSFGSGVLTYADVSSQTLTTFGTTDNSTVPHIGGVPATYMHIPAFTTLGQGYNAEFTNTGPNGGGDYVNQYTMIFDILEPGTLNWTPFFNTNPDNPATNDADLYLAYDGSIGIGSDYTDSFIVNQDTWYRVAFTTDLAANQFTIYVDGVQKYQHNGKIGGNDLLDARWALNSNLDAGPDLRLFNEGDTGGQYTHELYISSFFFADRTLSAEEIQTLGEPDANGIVNLTGDFNHDGSVDAADYVTWRKANGPSGDYDAWRAHFGQLVATGAGSGFTSPSAVPEPTGVVLACLTMSSILFWVRRR